MLSVMQVLRYWCGYPFSPEEISEMNQPKFKLSLFVSPTNSQSALLALYRALEHYDYRDYELAIVDVTLNPEVAKMYDIKVTPSVVLHQGDQVKVLSGDLSDTEKVRKTFGFLG
jgi:thioredoxin-like negative regulator of GroEL